MGCHAVQVRRMLATLGCLGILGCLPRERLNDECRWTDLATELPASGDPARHAHLVEDVRVAHWLAIRHADVTLPRAYTPEVRLARARCVGSSFATIARLHGVSYAEIHLLQQAREPFVDLLAVYLPMAALFFLLARRAAARVLDGFEEEGRWVAAALLALWMPLSAAFGVGAIQMWAWLVETVRLRDGHISYRLEWLPVFQPRNGWLAWQIGVALFLLAVASVVLGRRESASRETGADRLCPVVPGR